MTTHDKAKIIAAAKDSGLISQQNSDLLDDEVVMKTIDAFYTIAFEAGRQAEREACAVVAETLHDTSWPDTISAAIRARGDSK